MLDQIICGDCLDIIPTIEDKSVDMILADLPYGVTACKWDTPLPLDELWKEWLRICEGAIVLTATQPFTSRLVMSQLDLFKHEWIWDKQQLTNFLNVKNAPARWHESILVFSSNTFVYNPQLRKKTDKRWQRAFSPGRSNMYNVPKTRETEYAVPKSILSYPREANNQFKKQRYHPTQKPVALFEYLIRTYTNEGDLVLDPTAGSGTTAVACRKSNRHYICIEKEQEYCAIAEKRLKEML